MNRVYRLVVNHALGCLQVASEHARRGKGSGGLVRSGCVDGSGKGACPQEKALVGQILRALRPALPVIVLGMGMLAPGVASAGAVSTINMSIGGSIQDAGPGINQYSITSAGTVGTISITGMTAHSTEGTVSGSSIGINNSGSIGTLSNSGSISGYFDGISNKGNIDSLSNTNSIIGSGSGSGAGTGISNSGSIGTLSNSGTITGNANGINNAGSISNLSNIKSISGAYGIYNYGSIGNLINSGHISSTYSGIGNGHGSSIGSLNNSGDISASSYNGINNAGGISGLSNTGDISGGINGINNAGRISGLSNTGTITGNDNGIGNLGSIGSLSNSGIIGSSKDSKGIYNYGSIGTLNNSGTIIGSIVGLDLVTSSGGQGVQGTISTLINSGLIQGKTAIYLDGASTTLTNTGAIIGTTNAIEIANGNPSTLIFGTGSDIQGTINAGTTASTILLEGDPVLTSAAPIVAPDSTLTITQTGNWTVNDTWTVGTVTNDGVLAVGSPGISFGKSSLLPGTLNLTGDYVQESTGTLSMAIRPSDTTPGTDYSQLNITGTATLAGTVNIVPNGASSGYTVGESYDLVKASGGIHGTFGTLTGLSPLSDYVTGAMNYTAHDASLTLTPAPSPIPSSANLVHTGRAVVASTYVLNQGAESLVSSLLDGADQVDGSGTPTFTNSHTGTWGKGFGGFGRANAASTEDYGGMAGYGVHLDHILTLGVALAGYGTGTDTQTSGIGSQQVNSSSFGGFVYAIDTQGHLRISGDLGAGSLQLNSLRNIYSAGTDQTYETARGQTDGWYFGAGIQGQYLIPLGQSFLMPYGRINYVHTQLGGYTESGANTIANLNIAYGALHTSVTAFSAGMRAGTDIPMAGFTLIPWVSVGGTGDVGTLHVNQALAVGVYTNSETALVAPDGAFDTGAGVTLQGALHGPWTLKVAYNGQFARDVHFNTFDLLANYRW